MPTYLTPVVCLFALSLGTFAGSARGAPATPFDEETLDRIEELNEAIAEHYEELQLQTRDLEAKREIAGARIAAAQAELASIDDKKSRTRRLPDDQRENALRVFEEQRIDAKSRYLEALADKHAYDMESVQAFELHAGGILVHLERLADELEQAGGVSDGSDRTTRAAFQTLQQGTAVALKSLEEWGTLTRDDPRFRALWATARVLNRTVQRLGAPEGLRMTVELVRERTFVVRSLVDQARAMRTALDQQGLLLQVAAQNQMLHLHFSRLGAIRGLELPDLDLEDTTRRIIEDIEETPFDTAGVLEGDELAGFDDCASLGICN